MWIKGSKNRNSSWISLNFISQGLWFVFIRNGGYTSNLCISLLGIFVSKQVPIILSEFFQIFYYPKTISKFCKIQRSEEMLPRGDCIFGSNPLSKNNFKS